MPPKWACSCLKIVANQASVRTSWTVLDDASVLLDMYIVNFVTQPDTLVTHRESGIVIFHLTPLVITLCLTLALTDLEYNNQRSNFLMHVA